MAAPRSQNVVPALLIVLGSVMLVYVASQYGEMYVGQQRMAAEWKQQQEQPAKFEKTKASARTSNKLTRLVIPKIDFKSFVVEGSTPQALLLGPGHMRTTAEPGEIGNAVISGHRDTFFRHIHELNKGDRIYVDRGDKRYVYEVTGKKIVEPTDVSVIKPTKDAEMTLITCYPTYYIGPAPKRLIVFSKLQNENEAALTSVESSEAHAQAAGMGAAAAQVPISK